MTEMPEEAWSSGECLVKTLCSTDVASTVKALVLPLELKTRSHKHQDLFGIDLLDWLRWCAPEPVRWLPVVAIAWQPLPAILRRKPNLLLVSPGTEFREITDAIARDRQRLRDDIAGAQNGELAFCDEQALRRYAMGAAAEAAQVTYHDLANDHYAAYRLWIGYLHALENSQSAPGLDADTRRAISNELARAKASPVKSVVEIEKKSQTPAFQHFKLARSIAQIPAYPRTEGAETIFRKHVLKGLPGKARVLLVDDEFDKGVADILLQVLFRQSAFTIQSHEQAVYSSKPSDVARARFVCVKTADAARNWLRYWGELPFSDEALDAITRGWSYANRTSDECQKFGRWLFDLGAIAGHSEKSVHEALNQGERKATTQALETDNPFLDAAKDLLCDIDNPDGSPKKMATTMILDLRLEKGAVPELYDAHLFSSAVLRREVKRAQPKLPIIMFTASRQAMNYASLMAEATHIDGWLCKEAPDSPEDVENSTNALLYLVSRVHMFSGMSDWWHSNLGWEPEDEREFGEFFTNPYAETSLAHVSTEASRLFDMVRLDTFAQHPPFGALLGKLVPPLFQPRHDKIESLLVARRLIVATLLMTSCLEGQALSWDAEEFVRRLRGTKHVETLRKRGKPVYVSKMGNQREFWFPSLASDIVLRTLLEEELEWLQSQDWTAITPSHADIIQQQITSARNSVHTAR